MVGKWHLGHADMKFWPQNRGFDHFYGNLVGEVDYFSKERGGIIDWQRDGKFLKEDGYFTTLIGNEAVNIIETLVKEGADVTAYDPKAMEKFKELPVSQKVKLAASPLAA